MDINTLLKGEYGRMYNGVHRLSVVRPSVLSYKRKASVKQAYIRDNTLLKGEYGRMYNGVHRLSIVRLSVLSYKR